VHLPAITPTAFVYVRKRFGGLGLPCVATLVSLTHLGADVVLMNMGNTLVHVIVSSHFFSKMDCMVSGDGRTVSCDTVKSINQLGFSKSEFKLIRCKILVDSLTIMCKFIDF